MKKSFSLIELIVVISVLGVLATITTTNVKDVKRKAYVSAVKSNIKNIETATTGYRVEYGKYPVAIQPTIGSPQVIDFELLGTDYLKNKPKGDETYWIDYAGEVWASTSDLPKVQEDEKLSWYVDKNAVSYEVFEVQSTNLTRTAASALQNFKIKQILKQEVSPNVSVMEFIKEGDSKYLISAYDEYGFQTPPSNKFSNTVTLGSNQTSRTLYVDTHAETIAEWISMYSLEYIPEGTSIKYEFATSNDNFETISEYVSDFSSVEDSKDIRVKVTLTRNQGKPAPILEYMEIYFRTGFDEKSKLVSCNIDLLKTSQTCSTSLPEGAVYTPTILDSSSNYVDFKLDSESSLVTSVNQGSSNSSAICYRNSKDGSNWSDCVISPIQLNGQTSNSYVRVETTNTYVPLIQTSKPSMIVPPQNIESDENYIIYDKYTLVETASEKVEWISVDIEQSLENTEDAFIEVKYSYGDNIFSNSSNEFKKGSKTKKMKISTVSKAKTHVSEEDYPYINKIVVKYKKLDGTIKTEIHDFGRSFISGPQNLTDKDYSTFCYLYEIPNGVFPIEGNLSNRMVTFTLENGNMLSSYLSFKDENGQPLKFIDVLTNQKLNNYEYSISKHGAKHKASFIVPEGASYIQINGSNNILDKIYEIEISENTFAKPLQNITYDSTVSSVDLRWESNKDVSKVVVYREDGTLVGETKGNSITDKSLYTNTEYTYFINAVNSQGNRTISRISTKTTKPPIIWYGNSPYLFDGIFETGFQYTKEMGEQYVTWEGDLTNKLVSVKADVSAIATGYYGYLYILDENNNALPVIDATTNKISSRLDFNIQTNSSIRKFIMPEGANKIKIAVSESHPRFTIYEITAVEDLSLPEPIVGIKTASTKNTITLNWTTPTSDNYSKAVIYREGIYVGETTNNTFTDKSLLANTTYNYEIHSVSKSGNRTFSQISAKTIKPDILWHGSSPYLFDGILETGVQYTSEMGPQYVTWEGDLTNRVVSIKADVSAIATGYRGYFYVLDKNDNILPFINANNNIVSEKLAVNIQTNSTTQKIIMPEGASKIKIVLSESHPRLTVYEIAEAKDLTLPDKVTNTAAEVSSAGILISWKNPSQNFSKVVIYRNGIYLGETTSETFLDKTVTSNETFTYQIHSVSLSENRSIQTIVVRN